MKSGAIMPAEIKPYQPFYKEGTWAELTEEEYAGWVHLLTQRATHRVNLVKKLEDLINARNYLVMWIAKLEQEIKEVK